MSIRTLGSRTGSSAPAQGVEAMLLDAGRDLADAAWAGDRFERRIAILAAWAWLRARLAKQAPSRS